MAYRIAGTYVATCNCRWLCPCPVDQTPTGEGDQCKGAAAFSIREGNLDDTDLGGVSFVLYNLFPSNLTAGNWKVGIVVDEGASDEQAQAVERILSGEEGGPFGEFKPLIGDYAGMERATVTISDDSVTVSGKTEYTFEPFTAPDGSPTVTRGAMYGFAPEFQIGKTTGHSDAFGLSFDSSYGEKAEYEYSTEMVGELHPRA
jgi:hypothetical protein